MGNISYTAHVSNKKSAITSKSKLAGVAKHNLRKYKSSDYSKDNIFIVYGTSNLIDDVKTVYHKEFDEALEEYNKKQTRPDRRIEDYFEHVAGKEQDMAVEIIIQIGDREFWKQYDDMKSYIKLSYEIILGEFIKRLPGFVVANAVVHLDEDSPHMHIVGVPVADGYKKGLSKQVSKRKVFTKEVLSRVLQDELREVANKEVNDWFGEQIKAKSKGRNNDLSVTEYKVAQESRKLEEIQQQNNEEQAKNTRLRSSNASISYQIATQEKKHDRNIDMIAADEDRLERVRDNIDAAENEYAKYADMITDKKNNGEHYDERVALAEEIMYSIKHIKQRLQTEHVIVIGDINESPYEKACLSAKGFHALPALQILDKGSRTVYGKEYEKMYNPMWNLFGDFKYPPGTYYRVESKLYNPCWFMLDQVIISQSMIPLMVKEQLKIITKCGKGVLYTDNRYPNSNISDHFPIMCEFNI